MPRESIRSEFGVFEVRVGWTRDCDVQIGVVEAEERSLFWVLCENQIEMIGAEVRRIVAEANEPGTKPLGDTQIGENLLNMLDTTCFPNSGVWSTLQRNDVNQLVRILRRARDSAFGKDE